jgi:Zn-dependent protease
VWQSGTIRVAKIGGIAIDIHFTFALVVLWGAYDGWVQYGGSFQGAVYGIVAILLLFACVLLHELAHGLQARALGLVVRRVVLLPIGGLALLETPPTTPWHELVIALAGPLINLALTAAAGTALLVNNPSFVLTPAALTQMIGAPDLQGMLIYLLSVNLSLFVFNMLPAFPMDGGRVLRAGLALVMPYVRATRIAAWIGRALAALMALMGVIGFFAFGLAQYLLVIVVGFIVYVGAHNEEVYVRRQWVLARVEVGQIYQKRIETVSPWDDLTAGLITKLFKYEHILPVIVDERIVGLLGYDEAHRFVNKTQSVTVAHVMRTNFPTLNLRDTLWVALQAMTTDHLTMLPVVEENRFRGVVSLDDIDQAWRLVSSR